MTTVAEALPNIPPSISFNSFFASSKVGSISTPFPAHRPSALSTYGACSVSRKAKPSSRLSAVMLLYPAVGMLWRCIKPLANSLLPSSTAPAFDGPITGTPHNASSFLKKSYTPFTNGSSGPTTTISTPFSMTNFLMPSKSSALIATFSPTSRVPAFPGAIYNFSILGLWAIFHANACSRPPEPNSKSFIYLSVYILIE